MKKRENKNKKGISLIVLIITIAVIIILATAVILSISNNRPIDSAKEATASHNDAVLKESAAVLSAQWEVDRLIDDSIGTRSEYVKKELEKQGFTSDETDRVKVDENGKVDIGKGRIWDGSVATSFAEGSGTEDNPYKVSTGAELAFMISREHDYNEYFEIVSDIDLDNIEWTAYKNNIAGSKYFGGRVYGNNHKIYNLNINSDTEGVSLFGASVGEIRNLIIASGNVKGTNSVGAFTNDIDGNEVYNCTNYANVTGISGVGGIVGGLNCTGGLQIHNCTNYGTITGRTYVDEIWGTNSTNAKYENCTKSGKVVILNN